MKDLLLITPPFTQLNTPYPATAYLKGFLNTKGITSFQMDLGIEVICALFTAESLNFLFKTSYENNTINTPNSQRIFSLRLEYLRTIDDVIDFLQGRNQTLARQICTSNYLPQASRFEQIEDMEWAFGTMGIQDKAKHLATLYLEDLSDFIVDCIDENFGFSRYAERLGKSANSFDELFLALTTSKTETAQIIDNITINILEKNLKAVNPKLVCFSVPFPGNLYSAFKCAQYIKQKHPKIKIAMGGGFPNTELRDLKDKRVFQFFDYITLDDGELPIELLASNVLSPSDKNPNHQLFKRTFLLQDDDILYNNFSLRKDYKQTEVGTPDYTDLKLDNYISVIQIANPMHSLWSDGRWLKLTMAHGCYWGKCTFCDISLDYIGQYEPLTAKMLVDRMEELIKQTGEKGFHFVDEAAPPALMREVALEILRRNLNVSWWTNIRFEKSFTHDLCILLKASGCIAVSGGLEVASDRLLKLIQKGVTVEQVAKVNRNFTEAGIMVHAYLMYGYPTQTVQETIDSLEMVRQMFEAEVMQSGFWHQFALTAHSPVGMNPDDYGILPDYKEITFANNDIDFEDSTGIDHNQFSFGLKKSLYNYMYGTCFDFPLQEWFDFEIPHTTVASDFIENALLDRKNQTIKSSSKIVWIGHEPAIEEYEINYEGENIEMMLLTIPTNLKNVEVELEMTIGEWFLDVLEKLHVSSRESISFSDLQSDYENYFKEEGYEFIEFWESEIMNVLRENGLLIL